MYRILVTDGADKNTLSIIRNIGKSNRVDVLTSFHPLLTLSAYSKFSNRVFYIKYSNEEEYYQKLVQILKSNNYDVFLPVGLKSYVMASKVDLIEVWNGHSTLEENQKALELVERLEKPSVIGSDAHLYSELGNAIMVYNSLFDFDKIFYTNPSKIYQIELSNLIGHLKTGRVWNIPLVAIRLFWRPNYEKNRTSFSDFESLFNVH